jgi:hypothetical protein
MAQLRIRPAPVFEGCPQLEQTCVGKASTPELQTTLHETYLGKPGASNVNAGIHAYSVAYGLKKSDS